ncbi:hypothetical protein MMC30_005167 [Trapelia coarctata]|nr:hypothetical protein [Trapelia coarctata]
MAAPFGFSFGDFVAGIGFIKDLVEALRESGGSGEDYRAIISELGILQTALEAVQSLNVDDSLTSERIALYHSASLCQEVILTFYEKISKYNTALDIGGSGSWFQDSRRKVQWALCQKADVEVFRARVKAHAASISIMLVTLSTKDASIRQRRQERQSRSITAQLQIEAFNFMRTINTIAKGVANIVEKTSEVLRMNIQIFQIVLDLQHQVTHIPGQVDRQQPIFFQDATSHCYPFHLEFIDSAKALEAVLKVRIEHPIVRQKIERGEYVFQDMNKWPLQEIKLNNNWNTCFHPGQRVLMRVILPAEEIDYTTSQEETKRRALEAKILDLKRAGITAAPNLDENAAGGPQIDSLFYIAVNQQGERVDYGSVIAYHGGSRCRCND